MKREFSNAEVESILSVLNNKDSFTFDVKMPPQIRHAIRVNRQLLVDRFKLYQEGRSDIIKSYINNGHAQQVENGIHVDDEYKNALLHELKELSEVKNEFEIQKIDKEVLDNFLNTQDLTMTEEDVLLLFEE